MTREIRKDLDKAKGLYGAKKYREAFEIYNKHFLESPNKFDYWNKVRYCWCMYYLFIKDASDETELFEYAEIVTDTVKQVDLNNAPVCVYTQCVFSAIMFLKSRQDWGYMLYWLDKLDPKLLSDRDKKSKDSKYPSKKEDYYRYLSAALIKSGDYEECIETSKEALDVINDFAFNGDVWHKWRIGKSLNMLGQPQEALEYLNDVAQSKNDWYIMKEIADCHYKIGDYENAMDYASKAVLADGEANLKVNLYLLIYNILKDSNPDLALKHAKLYLAIKLESGAAVAEEIDDLNIDEGAMDIESLEIEIRNYWLNN